MSIKTKYRLSQNKVKGTQKINRIKKMLKRGDKVIFTDRYGSERIGRIELIATKGMRIAPLNGSNRISIPFSRVRKAPIADENQEVIEKVLFTLQALQYIVCLFNKQSAS